MMRNGVLLAEDTPNELLSLYGCDSLEDVFLLLCKKQGRVTNEETPGDIEMGAVASPGPLALPAPDPVRANLGMKSRKQIHKRASPVGKMTALLKKNFSRYWKNFGVMLFILGFPILQIGSFFIAIGHDPQHLPLAIVNDEVPFREGSMPTPHGAGPAYETADRCKGLTVSGCNLTRLSCRFLDTMNPTFKKRYYATQNSAEAAVKAGQAWGSLFFNTNFSESLTERLENGKDASDVALEKSDLNISLDMSDRQISLFLRKEILKTYQTFVKVLLKECDINDKIGEIPVHFNTPIFGTEDTSYTMFMAPGVILTIVFFLSTGITCTTMITEVHEGIWDRALVTGMTSGEILLSHVITQFAVLLLQTFECLLLSFLVFDMDNNGSLWLISLLTCLNGFCGMCYGIMWPVEAMPRVLRIISRQLPLTRASEAMRSIIIKGWGLTEPTVYNGFLTTFLWTAIMLFTCFIVLRLKKN
ncbi:hypothetical protein B566_EDAN010775 [Ephemera danica]|nr:hypothetical protein B566_EDAN010775 [Ephemera danica]